MVVVGLLEETFNMPERLKTNKVERDVEGHDDEDGNGDE